MTNNNSNKGGLIVVGSYVSKSSKQLQQLIDNMAIETLEINVLEILTAFQQERKKKFLSSPLLDQQPLQESFFHTLLFEDKTLSALFQSYLQKIVETVLPDSSSGSSTDRKKAKDMVIFTSRHFVKDSHLIDLKFISYFITQLVYYLPEKPSFVISKGGITSHEVAQYGLSVASAKVLGQIEKGIPVWSLSSFAKPSPDIPKKQKDDLSKKFQDLLYVVFPGNVGDEQALCRVANKLGVAYQEKKMENENKEMKSTITIKKHTDKTRTGRNGSNYSVFAAEIPRKIPDLDDMLKEMKQKKKAMAAFNICK
jgi:uncharacterized protein YgbK (DUF1537 family)